MKAHHSMLHRTGEDDVCVQVKILECDPEPGQGILRDLLYLHEEEPYHPPKRGVKEAFISWAFQDHFQVDLIDTQKMPCKGIYGVTYHWIMTVKDHSMGLMYCVALPNKQADYKTHELEKLFGFVGYPHIFHTNNGKEFTASVVAGQLKVNNPTCAIGMGHLCTPCDQGYVEKGNKIVQWVLKCIKDKHVLSGLVDKWASFLGQVTSVAIVTTHKVWTPSLGTRLFLERTTLYQQSVESPNWGTVRLFGSIWV